MAARHAVILTLVMIALAAPLLAPPAKAADVNFTLVASGFNFHRNTPTTPEDPTLVANAGDRLLFRIENEDGVLHTFTFPHFGVSVDLAAGSAANPTVVFVNITTSAADVGTWQFHCIPHSSGTDETRTGMVGWVDLVGLADTTPPTITHTAPVGPFEVGDPIPLVANVTDDIAVTLVRVNYTNVAGQSANASMALQAGNYTFTIPAQSAAGTVSYTLYAEDAAGNVAVRGPFTIPVAQGTAPETPLADYTVWIIVAVLVIVLLVALLLWRRSKAPKAPGT